MERTLAQATPTPNIDTISRYLLQAQGWHDDSDYAPLKQLRQANVDMEVFIIESD